MGVVVNLRPGGQIPRPDSAWVTKAQLAAHPSVKRTTRWVEQQMKKGLPSKQKDDGLGTRLYHLPTALLWFRDNDPRIRKRMEERDELPEGEPLKTESPLDRLADLEKEVGKLRDQLAGFLGSDPAA